MSGCVWGEGVSSRLCMCGWVWVCQWAPDLLHGVHLILQEMVNSPTVNYKGDTYSS